MANFNTKGITIGGIHSYKDKGLTLHEREIGSKEKKIITETIPYMNGFYDFSKMYGKILFEKREVTYTFERIFSSQENLTAGIFSIENWLNKTHNEAIYDDEMEGKHWIGSFKDIDMQEEEYKLTVKVTFLCQPDPE